MLLVHWERVASSALSPAASSLIATCWPLIGLGICTGLMASFVLWQDQRLLPEFIIASDAGGTSLLRQLPSNGAKHSLRKWLSRDVNVMIAPPGRHEVALGLKLQQVQHISGPGYFFKKFYLIYIICLSAVMEVAILLLLIGFCLEASLQSDWYLTKENKQQGQGIGELAWQW